MNFRLKNFWFSALILFPLISKGQSDGSSFVYNQEIKSVRLLSGITFLPEEIPSDSLTNPRAQSRFKPMAAGELLQQVNWVSFGLTNVTANDAKLVLEIQNPTLNMVRLFKVSDNKVLALSPEVSHQIQRPFKNHRNSFEILLPPNSEERYFIYVRSDVSVSLPLVVWSPISYSESTYFRNIIYGPYYGVLVFVLIFSIYLSWAFRGERLYLYYSGYILSLIIIFIDINGFGIDYLWTNQPDFDYFVVTVFGAVTMLFFSKFSEHYLQQVIDSRQTGVFRFFSVALTINLLISVIMNQNNILQRIHFALFEVIIIPGFFIFLTVCAIQLTLKGFKPAIFFIVAILFLLIGLVINLMRFFNWIPDNLLTEHAVQIGNLFEIMVFTLGLVFWFKTNVDEKQNLAVKLGEQQREIVSEKERIAHDLHDNIGTQLTFLSMGLNQLAKTPLINTEKVTVLYDRANETILELRDTIWVINKAVVTVQELIDKTNNLLWRLRQQDEHTRFELKSEGDLMETPLHPALAINLFRIIQEGINNSLKHSKAKRISISFILKDQTLEINLRDDGIGFDINRQVVSEHYGLNNMHKRAESCGVNLILDSRQNEGTTILLVCAMRHLTSTDPPTVEL